MAAQTGEYEKVPVVEVTNNDTKTKEVPSYGYGVRHVQSLIIFLAVLVGYLIRAHLGVSVVAMTYSPGLVHQHTDEAVHVTLNTDKLNNTIQDKGNEMNNTEAENSETFSINGSVDNISVANQHSDNFTELLYNELKNVTSDSNGIYKKYIWTKPIQEMVLSSFFLGYCVMQYFMSMIAQRWGGKLPMQIGLLINGLVSIATPWLAYWGGWQAVCVCRILQGMSQSGFFPSVQTLLAQWVPDNELGTISSFVYTGSQLGTIVSFQLSGVLAASPWGWPSIFWGTGLLCLLALLILTVFGAATPAEHKSISQAEEKYITNMKTNTNKKKPRVPLKAALSSKHVWATFATHIGSSIAFFFMFMQVPSYIHYSLGVNVKNSGLFSSLPYVASFCTAIFYGLLSDFLTNRKYITVKTARLIFNSVSQIGVAFCLIAATYTKSVSLALTLLVVGQATFVGIHLGWMVNYIDLSSNFSGPILAIGNTLTNGLSMILPILVSFIVTDVTNQTQWRIMFCLMAGLALATNAIFVVFMSADKQPWDDTEYEKAELDDKDTEKLKK